MIVPSVRSCAAWEHFPHDADVGVRGFGATPAEAFEQAALALTAVVTAARVEPLSSVEIRCEAPDLELLFVDLLNAIIYEMAVRSMLFGRFDVRIEGTALTATQAGGDRNHYVLDKLRWMRAEHIWPNGLRYLWTDAFGVVLLVSLYRALAKSNSWTRRSGWLRRSIVCSGGRAAFASARNPTATANTSIILPCGSTRSP